ncbi:MAG: dihydrodipicolinate synthase family protein [Gemmatimonadaceae bacterium]|nr:dihydrodipicolinate synthase family protein [Gemmatimonadaceae bacterium]
MSTPRLDANARGVFVIAATPFTDAGVVDYASLDRLLEFYLDRGVHGLTLLGMMGEAHKLTHAESEGIVRHALQRVDGRVPVVVGVSGTSLEQMHALTRVAMGDGACGVMVAPTAGLRTDDQIAAYVHAVCDALGDVPIVYQDYPPTTSVWLSLSLWSRLVTAHPQIVMLKAEDTPGLDKLTRIRDAERRGEYRRTSLAVGNGGIFLPQSLARGADAIMTGFGFPEMLVDVYTRHIAGDADGAEDCYDRYLPLVSYEQQPGFGLAVRKEVLRRRGVIAHAGVRAPGPRLTPTDHAELTRLLARLEARLGRPLTA